MKSNPLTESSIEKNSKPEISKSDKKTSVTLNDTILTLIEDYTETLLKPRLKEISTYLTDKDGYYILRSIPKAQCDIFEAAISESIERSSDLAIALISLNNVFKSEDLEVLNTSLLYKEILNGRICTKPANDQEALNLISEVRQILNENYYAIVDELETEYNQKSVAIIGSNDHVSGE